MGIVRNVVSSVKKVVGIKDSPRVGSPLLTVSEQVKVGGGYVSTSDPSITAKKEVEEKSGNVQEVMKKFSGGGGGGGRTPSSTTEQLPEIKQIPTTSATPEPSKVGNLRNVGNKYYALTNKRDIERADRLNKQIEEGRRYRQALAEQQKEKAKYNNLSQPVRGDTSYLPPLLYYQGNKQVMVKDIKRIDNKKMNTYSPEYNAFVTPSKYGGTATYTAPTYSELKYIKEQENKSDIFLLTDTRELQKKYTGIEKTNIKIENLSGDLDKLSEGKVMDNTWTGTDEEYIKYENKRKEYNRELERLKGYGTGTVKTGLFFNLDVPVSEIRAANRENEFNPITQFASIIGETIGGTLGGLGKKLPDEKLTLVEEQTQGGFKEVKILGGTQAGTKNIEWFGEERIVPAIESPSLSIMGEKVGQTVGRVSPYFIPYVFAGEQFERFGNVVKRSPEKNILEQGLEFYQESPVETLAIGGYGAFKLGKGVKGFAFTPRERLLSEQLVERIPTKAVTSMSKAEVIGVTNKGVITSRQFIGKGIAEDVTQGSRRYVSTRFQDWFGLKPTYSGKYTGDVLIKKTIFGNEKVINISTKEAKKGYEKIKEILMEKRKFTEQQAKDYLRRTAAERKGYATSFGGKIIAGEGSPLISITGERLSKGLKGNIYLNPTRRIQIKSPLREGKLKQEEVSTLLEEFKTKTPRGKEEGDLGTLSFFRGSSEEFNAAQKIGKQVEKYKEGAVAKKTGEEVYDLGTIETYKTGEVSKEITYLKPKKVSSSITDVTVINPTVQKETIFDLVSGTKVVRVKPSTLTSGDLTKISAEEWIKVSEETLPIKTGASNIIKPANIQKTPMSKTFGTKAEQLIETPKITEEATKKLVSDVSKILKPSNVKIVKTIKEPKVLVESNFPKMVGGTGVVESSFTGGTITTFEEVSAKNLPEIKMNLLSGVKEEQRIKQDLGLDIGLKGNSQLKEQVKVIEQFKIKPQDKIKINEQLKVDELQKVEQQQSQKFIQKQRTQPKQKPKINTTTPKIKIPIIIKPSFTKRILSKVEEQPDVFESILIKGGKEISLGKKQTQRGAEELLKSKIVSGLSASGFIKKGEIKLKSTELKLGSEFRPSKTSEFKIVELKSKRLRKSTTGKEIQMFRRKKTKGSIF